MSHQPIEHIHLDNIEQLRVAHDEACRAKEYALARGIACGEFLSRMRRGQCHGEWTDWLKENAPFLSHRTASNYIRLYKHRDEISNNAANLNDSSMRGVLKSLVKYKRAPKILTVKQTVSRTIETLFKVVGECTQCVPPLSSDYAKLIKHVESCLEELKSRRAKAASESETILEAVPAIQA
jgi:Protein of unknown function (DUF3102)